MSHSQENLMRTHPMRPILTLKPWPACSAGFERDIASVAAPFAMQESRPEARVTRAICFFDGENLRLSAREAFGQDEDVDPVALAEAVCSVQGWRVDGVRFYAGSPDPNRQPEESRSWTVRRSQLQSAGVTVFARRLQYTQKQQQMPDGTSVTVPRVKQKGVDIRMGLDVFEMALEDQFDVAVLFCRDQDLRELVPTIRRLAERSGRAIQLVSAFPTSQSRWLRGINGMQWLWIDQATYEACLDRRDRSSPGLGIPAICT
jgi:uncharacterized LabA/DUF88 family protein